MGTSVPTGKASTANTPIVGLANDYVVCDNLIDYRKICVLPMFGIRSINYKILEDHTFIGFIGQFKLNSYLLVFIFCFYFRQRKTIRP